MISRSDLNRLAKTYDQQCVSIYVPSESIGKEIGEQQDPRRPKKVLPAIKSGLEDYNLKEPDIEQYLEPIKGLIETENSWRTQGDCLAVFLSKQKMEYYTLPIEMQLLTYISDHFFLMPLIPLCNYGGTSAVQRNFRKYRLKISRTFHSLSTSSRISADPYEIMPAAFNGRVEMLFIQKSKDLFGLYDELNKSLIVDKENRVNQDSLYNLAAIKTWDGGGDVYLVKKDEMPLKGTSINALFRK